MKAMQTVDNVSDESWRRETHMNTDESQLDMFSEVTSGATVNELCLPVAHIGA